MEDAKVFLNSDWDYNLLEIDEAAQNLKIEVEVVYHSDEWHKLGNIEKGILKAVQATFGRVKLQEERPILISLALSDDAEVRRLNEVFRGKDKSTNVLSFPAAEDEWVPQDGPISIGDVILAYETVLREAEEQNISAKDHIHHLVVHGILHVLGFDHENDEEATIMEGLEKEILDSLKAS